MTEILIQACIPLAVLIVLGFVLGKLNSLDLKSVATLAIYAITPIVAFGSAARLDFTPALILLPVFTFIMAASIGLISLKIGTLVVADPLQRSLLPAACGSGNTGYFGLPIAMALFGPEVAGVYFLANLGVVIFETSLGYYFIARGSLSHRDALKRVARLPILYALAAGLIFAAAHIALPEAAITLWDLCRNAYVVIGMMIAGIALAQSQGFKLHAPLTAVALTGKFLLWPLAALGFAAIDPFFDAQVHQLIIVLSVAPIAANLPAYAAINGAPIRDAALLVLISTVVAIIALPLALPALLQIAL